MNFGLGIFALTLMLQVINQLASLLYQNHHSPNPKHSHLVTKGGILYKPFPSTLHPPPPRSPGKPPLWWNHPSLKRGE
jgi:hypothetical protein